MSSTIEKLREAISQAAGQYYRLVILARLPGSGKTARVQAVAKEHGYALLNINLELSKKMLELARTQRGRQVERLLKVAADPKHPDAQIGFLGILHTWGQTLQPHPHVHCVVPGGGRPITRTGFRRDPISSCL